MTSLPFEDLPEAPSKPDLFADFWAVYPRKVGRKKAQAAYAKALKRMPSDVAGAGAIMHGLYRYKANKPGYCDWMHPTTFLNGDHWEDEYDTPSKPDPDLAWQHKAAMAKTDWGRHKVPRQDKEELHRMGLLTDDEIEKALR